MSTDQTDGNKAPRSNAVAAYGRRRRRVTLLYVTGVALSCIVLTMGVNLLLIHAGVRNTDSIKIDATVQSCQDAENRCTVTYPKDGGAATATYRTSSAHAVGDRLRLTVYPDRPDRAYPEDEAPLPLGVTVTTLGLLSTLWLGNKLRRTRKAGRVVSRPASPAETPTDGGVAGPASSAVGRTDQPTRTDLSASTAEGDEQDGDRLDRTTSDRHDKNGSDDDAGTSKGSR